MPVIRHYIRYLLGDIAIMQQNPDEIVGLGVGCYAGIKERKAEIKEMVLMDICPFSLGVNTYNKHCPQEDLMSVIIPRNTSLPTSQKSYGRRILIMAVPFLVGAVIDYIYPGKGTILAWALWIILFVGLLMDRIKREK